jgi:hypothetical protein
MRVTDDEVRPRIAAVIITSSPAAYCMQIATDPRAPEGTSS